MKKTPVEQLIEWLDDGTITLLTIEIAYRKYLSKSKYKKNIQDLLCGSENSSGLIGRVFQLMGNISGTMEVVMYRSIELGKNTKEKP